MTIEMLAETPVHRTGRPRRITGGKLTGQKPALKMKEVWSIRARLELKKRVRDLALFNLAIDSKLRGCDLTALKGREQTRIAVANLIRRHYLRSGDYLFPSRLANSPHLSTRQYARIVQGWVSSIGLNPTTYGTHSLRRTKAALIYRKTGNLHAVQLLLGHSKLESTVLYLGVEVDDAIAISEGVDL